MSRVIQFDTDMLKDGYTPTEAMIYGYLRWLAWKTIDREFSPSIGLMRKTLNLSKRTIIRGIQKLEDTGLIGVGRTYRGKNSYFIADMDSYPAMTNFEEDKIGGIDKRTKTENKVPKWH